MSWDNELDTWGSGNGIARCAPGGTGGWRWSGGRRKRHNRRWWCAWRATLHGCSNPLQAWGDAPERPQQHRHPVKTAIHTLPHPRQLPLQHFKSGLLEQQEGVVLRSSNAATACSGSGPWWLRCSLLRWPVRTAREARVFLRSCYIVFLYCVAALNVFHVNND